MGIKGISTMRKWMLLCIIIIWFLATYFYLNMLYNPSVIFMEMTDITPASRIESVLKGAGIKDLSLRYEKPDGEGRLIMTTGGDELMEHVPMVAGRFIMTGEENRAVIGDQVAIREFNSLEVSGREIKVGNTWYRVVGVMDNSWDMMVSYGENKLLDGWHAMTVRYLPPDGKRQDIVIRDVERALALNGFQYERKLHYESLMDFHVNVAVINALTMFSYSVIWLYIHFKNQSIAAWELWKKKRNKTHGGQFIFSEKTLHWLVCKLVVAVSGMLLMGYWLIKQLRLPDEFLPDNLFSPSSWGVKLGNLLNYWDALIENGIRGIYKTAVYSWLLLVAMILVLLIKWAMQKETVKRGGTCETSSGIRDYENNEMESGADAVTNHRGCL